MDNKYENKNIRRGAAWRLGEMCLMWGANASSMWGQINARNVEKMAL